MRWKTDNNVTNEIHFRLFMKVTLLHYLEFDYRWLLQMAFFQCCQTPRVHFMACIGPEGPVWSIKLLLTAGLGHLLSCASLCQLLMAQLCFLCPNGCFA